MRPRVRDIISRQFKVSPDKITPESGPHDIPSWDSAGHLELLLELERQFQTRFDDDEAAELASVGAIEAALSRHGVKED